jgi:8-oxo-dGTP pyrophosphatase MutT (NUDIX family)
MHIKIYFGPKPLYLCDKLSAETEEHMNRPDAIFIDELDQHTVKTMIYEMQQDNIYGGVFLHEDLDELLNAFKQTLKLVQAAGGFVQHKDSALLIFRRGKWDLPKGKLDEGEDLETCAVREIQEETGLKNVKIIKPLTVTYHTYHEGDQFILKESHWFLMQALKKEKLAPQTEEGIDECKWVKIKDLASYTTNTHFSILDVFNAAVNELKMNSAEQ